MATAGDEFETEEVADRRAEFRFHRFQLKVISGPERGKVFQSDDVEVSIGTAKSNAFVLSDSGVSRHHCTITATPRGFLVTDLESKNGTKVSDIRIERAYLTHSAIIEVGATALEFEALGEELLKPVSMSVRFGDVLGESLVMRRIFALLMRVAPSDATVLLEGETGTGKGLVARTIREHSPRRTGPWIVVDCGAIPPTLIESELFGFEKGAFTGADQARVGAFEAANGGVLFLDEIGELPLDLQPKLLRALEDRTIQRLGSTQPIAINVRIIAATNRDLRQAVNRGAFRADLFYRLDILRLRIPPLRERREDIAMLVRQFYNELCDTPGAPPQELVETLERQEWPGNVRELRSAVERTVVTGDPSLWAGIMTENGPPSNEGTTAFEFEPNVPFRTAKAMATSSWERRWVAELMERNSGNISRAARAGRMDRSYLRDLVQRYGLKETD